MKAPGDSDDDVDGDEDDPDKIHHGEDGARGPGTVSNHGLGR